VFSLHHFYVTGRALRWLSVVVLLSVPISSSAETISGSVVSVLDGDTIEVLNKSRAIRIRLNAIDCPHLSIINRYLISFKK
jgi:endonuclease YncB( thermonuclease family)